MPHRGRRMLPVERLYEIVTPVGESQKLKAAWTGLTEHSLCLPLPSLTTECFLHLDKHSLTAIGGLPHLFCLEKGVTR